MSLPASILIYGRDLDLLETRSWVLQNAGYRTFITLDLAVLRRKAAEEPFDLLLLCHSLSPEACEEALAVVQSVRPKIKRLLMTANTIIASSAVRERTVSAFQGPKAMIATVASLLGTEGDAG